MALARPGCAVAILLGCLPQTFLEGRLGAWGLVSNVDSGAEPVWRGNSAGLPGSMEGAVFNPTLESRADIAQGDSVGGVFSKHTARTSRDRAGSS